ncbi:MAG: glycosyltransferase family 9 protein [Pseudomonadota bacterium]
MVYGRVRSALSVNGPRILILHFSRLGDMIQSLPAVKLLKEDQPESEITYAGFEESCSLLRHVPQIDRLVTIPLHQFGKVLTEGQVENIHILDQLIDQTPEFKDNYGVLLNFTHNWSSSYLSGRIEANEKTGRVYSGNGEVTVSGKWGKYAFATLKNRTDSRLNLVDFYTGMAGVRHKPVTDYLTVDPEPDRICRDRFLELGRNPHKLSIGFQLGASNTRKTWPLKNYAELGRRLNEDLRAEIILFGSPKERTLAEDFRKTADYAVLDLVGKTTLDELGSFLAQIDLLVSNDTGPMHIAAARGTRVVGLFMGTSYFGLTGPYGAGHIVIQSDYPCSPCLKSTACIQPLCRESISPDAVVDGVKLALGMDAKTDGDSGAVVYQSCFEENGTCMYRLVGGGENDFLKWLASQRARKAEVGQALWNRWLGLDKDDGTLNHLSERTLRRTVMEAQKACLAMKELYGNGITLCRRIVDEFGRSRPDLRVVQGLSDVLNTVDNALRECEGPLSIMREIHGYYLMETRLCDFPELAGEMLEKYTVLRDTLSSFENTLQEIHADKKESPENSLTS